MIPRDRARHLLAGMRLDHLIGEDGRPTEECWRRIDTLSSGERVMLALALELVDFTMARYSGSSPGWTDTLPPPPHVGKLWLLDDDNLARLVDVILDVIEGARGR
jgi:hypothetical protein